MATHIIEYYNHKGDWNYIVAQSIGFRNKWSNHVDTVNYWRITEGLACRPFLKNNLFTGNSEEALLELNSRIKTMKGQYIKRTKYKSHKNLIRRIQFDIYCRNAKKKGILINE